MRLLVAFFASLFALAVSAIDLLELQKKLPPCSLPCLIQGVSDNGCSIDDFACQCSKLEKIIKTVAPCLVKAGCGLENITCAQKSILPTRFMNAWLVRELMMACFANDCSFML